jgi:hypothetical protein
MVVVETAPKDATMPTRGRRCPKKKRRDDIPVEEFTEAWFEILSRPGVAKAVKALANEDGVSLDVMMCKTIANSYHQRGKPLPPKLREYITKHPDIPDAIRKNLLALGLN